MPIQVQPSLRLPVSLAPAAHHARAHPEHRHATLFWTAVRAGARLNSRMPLALLRLARRRC